jgi:hypothetical protein
METERKRLTLEELRETDEFRALTQKQKLFVAHYCGGMDSGKYDEIAATLTAYNCKTPEVARVMSYSLMNNIKIVAALTRHFNREPLADFLKQLDRAIRNKKLTVAQFNALKLKADLMGFGAKLPGVGHYAPGPLIEKAEAAEQVAKPKRASTYKRKMKVDYGATTKLF